MNVQQKGGGTHGYHARSIVKAVRFRVIATRTTMTVVYFVSGELVSALKVGAIEMTAKLFFTMHMNVHGRILHGAKYGHYLYRRNYPKT